MMQKINEKVSQGMLACGLDLSDHEALAFLRVAVEDFLSLEQLLLELHVAVPELAELRLRESLRVISLPFSSWRGRK